jgi:hypothetical protein
LSVRSALFFLLLASGASLLLGACGASSSPAGSTLANPAFQAPGRATVMSLKFVDVSGAPVAGVSATIDGQTVVSDGKGVASFGRQVLAHPLDTSGPDGFVQRNTWATSEAVSVWREEARYLDAVVYNIYTPGRLLSRPDPDRVRTVSLSAELAADPGFVERLLYALGEWTRATGVPFAVVDADGEITMETSVDDKSLIQPNGAYAAAATTNTFYGNVIHGSRIVFRFHNGNGPYDSTRTGTVLHELGHTLGFGHSPDDVTDDIMNVRGRSASIVTVSPRLERTWAMMVGRRPGQSRLDNDRGFGRSSARRVITVVD